MLWFWRNNILRFVVYNIEKAKLKHAIIAAKKCKIKYEYILVKFFLIKSPEEHE